MSDTEFFHDNTANAVGKGLPWPEDPLSGKSNPLTYDGRTSAVLRITLTNIILNIITLGIHSFWGRARLRRYIIGVLSLDGDRFEFFCTGKELFWGFIRSIPALILIFGPLIFAGFVFEEKSIWQFICSLPIIYSFGFAYFSALRYRASRTIWRGIRASLDGSAHAYAAFAFGRLVLNIISLGFLIPYSDIAKHKFIMDRMSFGNVPVEYGGRVRGLMASHIITLLLFIPTLGLSRFWYSAALARAKMEGLKVGDIHFKSDVTGGALLRKSSGNLLILILTLGLGLAFIVHRNTRFFAQHSFLIGDLKTSKVLQSASRLPSAMGEALGDSYDFNESMM